MTIDFHKVSKYFSIVFIARQGLFSFLSNSKVNIAKGETGPGALCYCIVRSHLFFFTNFEEFRKVFEKIENMLGEKMRKVGLS